MGGTRGSKGDDIMEITIENIMSCMRTHWEEVDKRRYAESIKHWYDSSLVMDSPERKSILEANFKWLIQLFELGYYAERDKIMGVRKIANSWPF